MKICHVNLARGFSGGESQSLLLIKEQLRNGYNLVVVAKKSSPFALECQKLKCELIEVSSYFLGHSRSITQDCDAVHVHEGQAVYWALIQKMKFKVPYLVTRRIDNPYKQKWLSRLAYSSADCIVCVSHAVEEVANNAFPEVKTNVVHDSPIEYPIDQNLLRSFGKKYEDKFLVIQAAKLYEHKGFDVTIAAAKLLSNRPEIHFCLLGDGPEESNLKLLAEGAKSIEFLGRQSAMGTWFNIADTVILPSHTEGMGSVLLEATLAGTPVIGSRAGGIPDAIREEVNGLLIDINNPEQLAQAILRLKDDPLLRERIHQRAPDFISEFSIQKAADRYQHIYQSLQ